MLALASLGSRLPGNPQTQLPYKVANFSSEELAYPAKELNQHSVHSKGWQSDHQPSYPQVTSIGSGGDNDYIDNGDGGGSGGGGGDDDVNHNDHDDDDDLHTNSIEPLLK